MKNSSLATPLIVVWFPESDPSHYPDLVAWFKGLAKHSPQASIRCIPCSANTADIASMEATLQKMLLRAEKDQLIVIDPTENAVAALSRAIKELPGQDLILLAAGAHLPENLLTRLKKGSHNRTAAVVPLSNTASPTFYANRDTAVATLDQILSRSPSIAIEPINKLAGPCIFFPASALAAIGFDADFAHSIPEALDDYAQRALVAGFRLDIAPVYVGLDDSAYTSSPEESLIKSSPITHWLDSARLANANKPKILLITHDWGGGTERHVRELCAQLAEYCEALILRPSASDTICISWEKKGEDFKAFFPSESGWKSLVIWLQQIGIARVHFHHIHRLPEKVLGLAKDLRVPFDVTLHDYWPICPQYHLTTATGYYCGEPDAAGCARCLAERPAQWSLDIGQWREKFHHFLSGAARIFAPSLDTANRIRRYFPNLPISITPPGERIIKLQAPSYNIALLGKLSRAKGLAIVKDCAQDARQRNLPLTFHVLGPTDEPLPQWPALPLFVHGEYQEEYLGELLATIRPQVFFFPAQTPETYSYTLSTALAYSAQHVAGILASDLGAAIDRLIGLPFAERLPATTDASAWNDALLALCQRTTSSAHTAQSSFDSLVTASNREHSPQ